MTLSVRMDPLLEKELEQAARRRGITKSQFIIEAIERALGRNNPGELYLKVMQEMAAYPLSTATTGVQARELSPYKAALKENLRAKYARNSADFAQTPKARRDGGVA